MRNRWIFRLFSAVLILMTFSPIARSYPSDTSFSLEDFYSDNKDLDYLVEQIIDALSYRAMISQMIMTSCGSSGRSYEEVLSLIENKQVGGVLFLGNTMEGIRQFTRNFTEKSLENSLLLPLFAIDGEPSLIHERIRNVEIITDTRSLKNEDETREVALSIMMLLRDLGIHVNFAPVCDFSLNDDVIGNRSFGSEPAIVSALAQVFIQAMQENGVVATAKHFPGHGTVEGDSHRGLVFVDGDPPEIPVFQHQIDHGVISIMVGHIAVKNSRIYGTQGMPASLSHRLIMKVLRNELGFEGIVVSDALNMEAVKFYDFPALEAVRAGCDVILMPEGEAALIDAVRYEMGMQEDFKRKVMDSVRKIIRLKICLGLVNNKKFEKSDEIDDIF